MKGKAKEKNRTGYAAPLDTLAQLGTNDLRGGSKAPEVEPLNALKKRARAKYYGRAVATRLAELRGPLEKSYRNTIYCANVLEQQGDKLTGRYCNARWCPVCNRIRTAKLIAGYGPTLATLPNPHFVTLTIPNVPAPDLRAAIEAMIKTAQRIQDAYKKRHQRGAQGWQLVGLRKLECTHNSKVETFHPHFHYIVSGEAAARALVADWLRAMPAASHKAQDVRQADTGAGKELFKYFSKLVTQTSDGRRVTNTPALDVIFQAMKGKRVFQPIGIAKVPEDIEALQSVQTEIAPDHQYWEWLNSDWASISTGEYLTGNVPSPAMERLLADIL